MTSLLKIKTKFYSATTLLVIFVSALLLSCDNTIDPFIEGRARYSIYGMLAVFQDSNYIRVKDLSDPLRPDSTREINATVILENLKNGQSQTLQDSVVVFDGIYTHNFLTTMDIQPDARYRITIKNPTGYSIQEDAYTPRIANVIETAEIKVQVNYPSSSALQQPSASQQTCYASVRVSFSPVREKEVFYYAYTLEPFRSNADYFCEVTTKTGEKTFKNTLCPTPYLTNDEGEYLGARTISLTQNFPAINDTQCGFKVKWRHFGIDAFDIAVTSDSLVILGGSGQFGSYYQKEVLVKFPAQ